MGRNWREKLVFFVAGQERERDLYNSVQIFGRFKLIYYDYCCWICLLAAIFSHSTSFQLRRNMLRNVWIPSCPSNKTWRKIQTENWVLFFYWDFFTIFFFIIFGLIGSMLVRDDFHIEIIYAAFTCYWNTKITVNFLSNNKNPNKFEQQFHFSNTLFSNQLVYLHIHINE